MFVTPSSGSFSCHCLPRPFLPSVAATTSSSSLPPDVCLPASVGLDFNFRSTIILRGFSFLKFYLFVWFKSLLFPHSPCDVTLRMAVPDCCGIVLSVWIFEQVCCLRDPSQFWLILVGLLLCTKFRLLFQELVQDFFVPVVTVHTNIQLVIFYCLSILVIKYVVWMFSSSHFDHFI